MSHGPHYIPTLEPIIDKGGRATEVFLGLIRALVNRYRMVDAGAEIVAAAVIHENSMAWLTAAPTDGTWRQGDVVWKSDCAVGQPIGWRCTVSGTPGTWVAMVNL